MDLATAKKLDVILKLFAPAQDYFIPSYSIKDIVTFCENKIIELKPLEAERLTEKIIKDEYLDVDRVLQVGTYFKGMPDTKFYKINFEGEQFYRKGGYEKNAKKKLSEARWKKIEDLPKRYWFIAVLVTSLGLNLKDVIEYFSKKNKEKSKIESLPKSQPEGTNQTR